MQTKLIDESERNRNIDFDVNPIMLDKQNIFIKKNNN